MTVSVGYKVNDITALKAIDTSDKVTGYVKLVASVTAWFMYNSSSSDTGDDINTVTPTSGVGRWFRAKAIPAAADITNLSEYIDDRVAALLQQGTNITLVYDDSSNTLTVSATGASYTDENAQDAIGTIFVDGTTIDLIYSDSTPSISAEIVAGSITNTHISASANIVQSKISGLVSDLAAINAEIDTKADATHTHTSSDITNFTEAVQDAVGGFVVQGSNITVDYDDTANTLTISSTASGGGGLENWDDLYSSAESSWDSEY